jgi:hypothetical protein
MQFLLSKQLLLGIAKHLNRTSEGFQVDPKTLEPVMSILDDQDKKCLI